MRKVNFNMHISDISSEERISLSDVLQNSIGQELVCLKIAAYRLSARLEKDKDPEVRSQLNDLHRIIEDVMKSMRQISRFVRPRVLQEFGLVSAIQNEVLELRKNEGVQVEINSGGNSISLPPEIEFSILRVVRETLRLMLNKSDDCEMQVKIIKNEEYARISIIRKGSFEFSEKVNEELNFLKSKAKELLVDMEITVVNQDLISEIKIPLYFN